MISLRNLGLVFGLVFLSQPAMAVLLDFEGFGAGTIIDDEYFTTLGISVNGVNTARGGATNLAVIFDTHAPTGGDPDLAGPFTNPTFGLGAPGNVLIIHEHPGECNGIVCSDPDDEGARPAGYFDFFFDSAVTLNSIDFFDVEGAENGNTPDNAIRLFDEDNLELSADTFYTPNTGGDNTWGRVAFGVEGVRSMRIFLGGSGAIDNIDFEQPGDLPPEVPAPSPIVLMALGLSCLAWWRRRPGR